MTTFDSTKLPGFSVAAFILLSLASVPRVFGASAHTLTVTVPTNVRPSKAKAAFAQKLSAVSTSLFKTGKRSAVAPLGGTKITPLLELDLDQLVIVTDSYPGIPEEIEKQFNGGSGDLASAVKAGILNGSMSTSDVLRVNASAQILSRLKLELGVGLVKIRYWNAANSTVSTLASFADRSMEAGDPGLLTTYDFTLGNRARQVVLLSGYIQGDASSGRSFPKLIQAVRPAAGFSWAYLSADGLGFFSANANNGFARANRELIGLLAGQGALVLDYPTSPAYWASQVFGGIHFMEGRKSLEGLPGLKHIETFKVGKPGIFGYCLKTGDEVRIYQKTFTAGSPANARPTQLKQVGETTHWLLN
ncbi:MAG: hypothetical protein H7222_13040 [Methylotenera sp.]|nr:hypothetical protein [Oligoflexia bacterium]